MGLLGPRRAPEVGGTTLNLDETSRGIGHDLGGNYDDVKERETRLAARATACTLTPKTYSTKTYTAAHITSKSSKQPQTDPDSTRTPS